MLKPLVIWGASGHARVLREFIGQLGYELVAVFDNQPELAPPFAGVPLYCGQAGFGRWRAEHPALPAAGLVAIGGARGEDRLNLQQFMEAGGVRPIRAVHPTAFLAASATLGAGCQLLAQAAVCAEARLGDACIVNTAASVDHECVLGPGVHVAPGARLAGCVQVGEFTLIAVGAVILPRVKIGRYCIIGAGAVVTRDVPDKCVVCGNPARFVRQNIPV